MFTTKLLTRTITIVTMFALALSGVSPAYAAAPSNDNFGSATIIGGLPFSDSVDNTEATTESGESQYCVSSEHTVWYSFTPTNNVAVKADMTGSSFGDTIITAYQLVGSGLGGLSVLGCAYFGNTLSFSAQANTTYYLQAGSSGAGGDLHVNLKEIPPPANDDFASATIIPSLLPFDDTVDTSGAGIETGEQTPSCAYNGLMNTVWYTFTPTTSGSISARVPSANFTPMLAVYTGNSLASLTEVACQPYGNILTFHTDAGTIYYFQVGIFYPGQQGSPMQFHLDVTSQPVANFYYNPNPPSIFDTIQFCDNSSDPGQVGFQSFTWDLGDGTTSTDGCVTHQYAADADYTVQHSVTTFDGRSASTSQVVQVRTHDVAITKVSAPLSASKGQTRSIIVYLNNKRYTDNIRVDLYKSVMGGFEFVGSYIQSVPVRSANRTTAFTFNYTFTSSDASVGKVTFKAIATIIGANDVFPADNEVISSPPTKVGR